MASPFPCPDCKQTVPGTANICPHCGRPGFFPNVREAESKANLDALEKRFDTARAGARGQKVESTFDAFEAKAQTAHAVWCKPLGELVRLSVSEKQGAATYYQQIEAGIRLPDGDRWDALRRLTDEALFPGYKEHIRFAALSVEHEGPTSYGPTSLTFRDDFIAHRASVFEENSVLFMERRNVKLKEAPSAAVGFRAPWRLRGRLAAAKLGPRLTPSTTRKEFEGILLRQGPKPQDEDFVEVHIYGPMTVRAMCHARIRLGAVKKIEKALPSKAQREQLKERLAKLHVKYEELP